MDKTRTSHRTNLSSFFVLCGIISSFSMMSRGLLYAQIDTAAYWNTLPRPAWGWNSLSRCIHFPELAQRAGLHESYLATVAVDSCGTVTEISVTGFDGKPVTEGIFIEPLTDPIKTIRWIPGSVGGKSINSSITVVPIISRDFQAAVVDSTHDPRLASYADHIVRLSDGRIIDILQSPQYLGGETGLLTGG